MNGTGTGTTGWTRNWWRGFWGTLGLCWRKATGRFTWRTRKGIRTTNGSWRRKPWKWGWSCRRRRRFGELIIRDITTREPMGIDRMRHFGLGIAALISLSSINLANMVMVMVMVMAMAMQRKWREPSSLCCWLVMNSVILSFVSVKLCGNGECSFDHYHSYEINGELEQNYWVFLGIMCITLLIRLVMLACFG